MKHVNDQYGYKVTNAGPAYDVWLQGLHWADTFDASGIIELEQAVQTSPDFALAHAALAKQRMFHGFHEEANHSLDTALSLANHVTEREASLIAVLTASLRFQANALNLALQHIKQWPLDRLVFSLVIGPFGLLAFSQSKTWREDCLSLMQENHQFWPNDDWWYLSALAFSLAECGETDKAEDVALQAWEVSNNGNCAHTLSHVYKEQDNNKAGSDFLENWLVEFGQQSDMRHHLVWHQALLNLQEGLADQRALSALFKTELDPNVADPMPLTTFSDNASFLWRCQLNNTPLEQAHVTQTLEYANKFYPEMGFSFADLHIVFVTALTGSDALLTKLKNDMEQLVDSGYWLALLDGAIAFTQRDFTECKNLLEPILGDTVLVGGSNPQRAVVWETYASAKRYE